MGKRKKRGNGQGTAYKVGSTYRAVITRYIAGRRLTASQSGFATKREALDWCATNRVERKSDALKTFEDVWSEWASVHLPTISKKKADSYRAVYENSTDLYGVPFADLRVTDFQKVVNSRKESYYARKIFKSVYSMMSEYAIWNGYINNNYAELIELPAMEKPDKRPFTPEEISLLWDYNNKHRDKYSSAALIMIYTGMRYGEISTINPTDIHLEEGYLKGGIKTDAGKAGEILIIPKIRPLIQQVLMPINIINNITAEGFRKGYNRMQSEAGIPRHTVHECRHTTATILASEGVHPSVISEIMRHSNYSQTMEYTHVSRTEKIRALEAMEKVVIPTDKTNVTVV